MDPLIIAIIVAVFTLIVLFSGIPIAFGLSFVSIVLLVSFEGFQMLDVFAETFYAGLNSFVLLSIPMFILMGMAVANSPAGKDLYAFWGDRLCKTLNRELNASGSKLLINLASQEYFKSTQPKNLEGQIVSPVFKDEKNGKFKIISFYAKKARGMMASHLIKNRIDSIDGLQKFNDSGYQFEPSESTDLQPVFLRSEQNRIAA